MSNLRDDFVAMRYARRQRRREHGVECPRCKELRPKTNASILLPGQRCRVDGYRDPRSRIAE